MITYDDLYSYIELSLETATKKVSNFFYTLKFCKQNNIQVDRLLKILYDFGGHNDLEIILNVSRFISKDTPINKDIETPIEYAIRNNLYTRFHEGMWVRCKKSNKGAVPDLNTAYQQMFPNKLKNE